MARRIDQDPLEEAGLIQLHNYKKHPTHHNYHVFYFKKEEIAMEFETLLKQKEIPFEKDTPSDGDIHYYFAITSSYMEQAKKLNYLAYGTKRKPMIANQLGRYALVIFFLFILVLGIISYIKS